jgi:putative two-component system response regulator
MDGEKALLDAGGLVLAVDDHVQNLELVEEILSSEGFTVETAADGQAALDAVKRRAPDCIVLDVMMPRLDGFETCRRLKNDRATRAIPIVMLTALSEVDDKVKGLESGADDFLNKPVDRRELQARVRSLVKIKRLHDELDTSETIIFSMEHALEGKHPLLGGHSERVAILSLMLGRALELAPTALDVVGRAAYLHDLGKIGVPEALLGAERPLERDERVVYERHPEIGAKILEPLRSFAGVRRVIRAHHERLDGSGYPDGVSGAAISTEGEIVALANFYEEALSRGGGAEGAALVRGAVARGEFRRELAEQLLRLPAVSNEQLSRGWQALLPAALPARPGKIVVADDAGTNREFFGEVLAQAGHEVIALNGGRALLDGVAALDPDLVIVDVRMPDLDGFAVCSALKKAPDTEFLPVILVTAMRGELNKRHSLSVGADDFLIAPINRLELQARVQSLLRMRQLYLELEEHQHVILSLATALEAKDPYTRGHSERVGQWAGKLARELGMPDADVELMRVAGLLHDIGKIGIPERIINKPGRLTEAEFKTIMTHPPRGETMCRPLRTVQAALPLIRHHHERYNGRGYPDHLVGEQIPYGARVLALADAFDALTSERSYRKTLPRDEALRILTDETERGLWDPKMFAALVALLRREP